jgi:Flp pilus assembly protein TadG
MTARKHLENTLWLDERGATAVEFALIAPLLITMLIGTLSLCGCLFLVGSMHYAVEEGARCASVKTLICTDSSSIVSYTQNRYFGPNPQPTFAYSQQACGNSVTGTVTYTLDVGFRTYSVPVSASACFP